MSKFTNEDTQVHMTAVYSRSGAKRSFGLVIKGMLITTTLLGAISLGGGLPVSAAPHSASQPASVTLQVDVGQDEKALIDNMRLAIKAINENGWSLKAFSNLMDSLNSIAEAKNIKSPASFKPLVIEAENLLRKYNPDGLSELLGKRSATIDLLASLKDKLGINDQSENASKPPVQGKGDVKIAAAIEQTPSVVINGVLQHYEQPPVLEEGNTLVPLRGIFETLGATVTWEAATKTVTAKKNDTVIQLTIGNKEATVNGKKVSLSVPSKTINEYTMVPLRFVSEALGATVSWDAKTKTAFIETTEQNEVVNGIKVKFGRHDYASNNQSEYDQVVKIAEQAIKRYDDIVFGGVYSPYYYEFLDGARWTGDKSDRSDRNRGLKSAEDNLGDLVKAGVSKENIIKAYKTAIIANDLAKEKRDPGDGSPRSAYDNLVRGISDCDSFAQVYSLVFDMMDFNTAIIGGSGHAEVLIQVDGSWFECAAGSFQLLDVSTALTNGSVVVSQPTNGTSLK